jgi:hypothetical protein
MHFAPKAMGEKNNFIYFLLQLLLNEPDRAGLFILVIFLQTMEEKGLGARVFCGPHKRETARF